MFWWVMAGLVFACLSGFVWAGREDFMRWMRHWKRWLAFWVGHLGLCMMERAWGEPAPMYHGLVQCDVFKHETAHDLFYQTAKRGLTPKAAPGERMLLVREEKGTVNGLVACTAMFCRDTVAAEKKSLTERGLIL